MDSEVDCMTSVENADFCSFRSQLAFVGLALSKIADCGGGLPHWIIQRAVELGRVFDGSGMCLLI